MKAAVRVYACGYSQADGVTLQEKTSTKRDQIVDGLRQMILTGVFERGAPLRQDVLAERFESSITPVREALRILESDGLVVSEPHRGVRVAALDLDRVKGNYVVRRLVEPYAMRRAVLRLSSLDVSAVEALAVGMERAAAAGDGVEVRRLNRAFHFYFYERCGLPSLADQISALWTAFPWDVSLDASQRAAESCREHRGILDSVKAADLDAVAGATERHIRHGYLAVAARIGAAADGDPFEPSMS